MSCYHPLKRFILPNGEGKVCSSEANCVFFDGGKWKPLFSPPCGKGGCVTNFQYIPCGQCIGCRLDYSRKWADRMVMESSFHEHSWFLTLTYDQAHLPRSNLILDEQTGEVVDSPFHTLVKKDMQDFIKRLRKNTNQKIRYYLAGEYGDETYRPHYHLILFGLKLDDLQFFKFSDLKNPYYVSPMISKCWNKGNHFVAAFCWETAAYTARYVVKKLKGREGRFYEDFGIEPPFVLMSRKPGLSKDFYDQNKDYIYRFDGFYLPGHPGVKMKPPRYFDKLFDLEEPDKLEEVKRRRELALEANIQSKCRLTDLSYYDILAVEESAKMNKVKALGRKGI